MIEGNIQRQGRSKTWRQFENFLEAYFLFDTVVTETIVISY